ncbi:MAG: hypothetical protein Q9167_002709 [Letrouitia subvulpina]
MDDFAQLTDKHIHGLKTVLKREGPILAAVLNMYAPISRSDKHIDGTHNPFVRCYDNLVTSAMATFPVNGVTRCTRQHMNSNVETGLPFDNDFMRSFSIKTDGSPEVDVNVYFADGGVDVSTDDLESSKCLAKAEKCTWHNFTSIRIPLKDEYRDSAELFSKNILVVEFALRDQTLIYEFITLEYFATYSLDTSSISNPLHLVQVEGLLVTNNSEPLVVSPDWFLATWSVDDQGFLSPNRSTAKAIVRTLLSNRYIQDLSSMEVLVTRSYLQALSTVKYNYEEYESNEAARQARVSGRNGK